MFRLPQPKRLTSLPPLILGGLEALKTLAAPTHGLLLQPHDQIAHAIHATPDQLQHLIQHLTASKHLLKSPHGPIAIASQVSAKLHSERVAAKKRQTPQNRPFHAQILHLFPHCQTPKRSPNYNLPTAFKSLLQEHPHYHATAKIPSNIEQITDAFYPGELTALLTVIEEQKSANRTPVLIYSRKAIYLAVQRTPKR